MVEDDAHSILFSNDKPKTRQRHAVGVGVVRLGILLNFIENSLGKR